MDYDTVLQGKYPAKQHARRVVDYIRSKVPGATGILYLQSRSTKKHEDCDQEEPFRQRRFFYYLTGCPLADSYLVHDIDADKSTLYIPPINPEEVIWSGLPMSVEQAKAKYDVDEVEYKPVDINARLAHIASLKTNPTVFAVHAIPDEITFLGFDEKDFKVLREAIETCRSVKDDYEIAMIGKANNISSAAHRAVLEKVKYAKNERELEAVFLGQCIGRGARNQAYDSIVASGTSAATLHYVKNNEPLDGKLNLLLDAGCEWDCYASDITRTFPISGKFSKESREIYDIVLKMQNECIAVLKEGVLWEDVHLLAHKILIDGLLALGILRGDKDEILQSRTSVAFMPHGLGHYLGMDTHDTGGNPNYADPDPMLRYLRVRGRLPENSVITVEPGIYFCRFIIEPVLKDQERAKYIDSAVLERYWDVGGVRIEDNLVIKKDGSVNLTTAVKDPAELERVISES
ncbi:putative Xaa-Pro aminopeptidase [Rhypophila decipiens]|uniref:Xaa-Pro aminopeptidase n=1 Tax=Rhypophila decipiens TaxID=261697 RepID=A0AAN6XVZ2_9PEZI|nr:putative Xaa-Pro aminopeptidase [Rhypophila decipiens]